MWCGGVCLRLSRMFIRSRIRRLISKEVNEDLYWSGNTIAYFVPMNETSAGGWNNCLFVCLALGTEIVGGGMQTKIVCYWMYSPTMPGYQCFKSACRETLSLIVMQWCQGFNDEWSEWIVSRGVGNNCLFVYLGPGQGLCRERNRWVCEVKIVSGGMQTKSFECLIGSRGKTFTSAIAFTSLRQRVTLGFAAGWT